VQTNLEKQGYTVLTAQTGTGALQLIGEQHPDLVILDVEMPELSGLEVLRQLREAPATQDLPVVMLTAKDELEDIFAGSRAGADVYLPKPFRLPRLVEAVEELLAEKK
jgi:DNA-binding response OmpR family regulator